MSRRVVRQTPLTVDHPAIQAYYSLLDDFRHQRIRHEGAVSTAFENLLTVLTKQRGWILIPLLSMQGQRRLVPDAAIRDQNGLPRGYWEAKYTDDDLDEEIRKKKAKDPTRFFRANRGAAAVRRTVASTICVGSPIRRR